MADPRRIGTRAEWTEALQALFAQAGMSYHVLAERCGTSASTLQKMVTGQSFPRPSTVRLFVHECGERDSQPWVDARARIAAIDVTLKRARTPPGRQVRIGAVPRAADSFQDRGVAARLREAAEQDGTVVLTQVLAGMGGVGKTQLAAAHARQAWHEGAGLLVWVNAASRDAIVTAYADAALALGLPGVGREDPERSAQVFLAWAETTIGRWWLVVLDDVQRPGDLNGLWPPAAESAAGGQVLITTRLREAALASAGRRTVEIWTFTPQEARAYLQAALGDRGPREQADVLAGALGMLPLALAQAAAYIRNADITIGRYLDLMSTRLLRDVVPEPGHLTDDHQRTITATWELSIDQASQARPAGLARPLLQLASVLDPAGIPQQTLSSPPALAYLASALAAAATDPCVEAVDETTVDETLRVLHRYSLIDHDRASRYREVRVHQLVQRATRENLISHPGQGPAPLTVLAHTAASALAAVWPEVERDELGQVLRANTTALQQAVGPALWNHDEGGHGVLFQSATSLGETGQVTAAYDAYTALYHTALQHLGPDHPDTLSIRHNLAEWRGQAGDAAGAATALEELLTDRLRVLGPDHPDTLTTRHNLAYWRGQTGDAGGAATAFEELLTDRLRVLGADHPDTLDARHFLAYWRGQAGDAAGAATAFEEVLTDYLRILGPDHLHTLATRYNLADCQGEAGDTARAATAAEELLADCLRVLGPDHLLTLSIRHNLANWRGQTGDAAGAATAFEELLTDRLRVLGADHPDTLATRHFLANWRGQAGDAAGAAAAFEEVLADYLRILGPDHPGTLNTRYNLAEWRGQAGDAAGAAAAFEEVLADYLRILGPDHLHTLATRYNLAEWRGQAGDAAGAAAALQEALADYLRILGPDHPDTLAARHNLAYWREQAGPEADSSA